MRRNRSTFLPLLLLSAALWFGGHAEGTAQTGGAITAQGRVVRTGNVMQIGTAASGVVAELLVHEGMNIEKGQPLVRIECTDVAKDVDARKSNLEALGAALARIEHGPRSEEIAIANANLALAQARADEASAALQRIASPDETTISKAQVDKAQRDAKVAAAELEEARAKLTLLKAGSRPEDISEAKFLRDAAKARVDEATARLDRCTVRAPASGAVLDTHVTLGQFVSAAVPQPLLTMIDSDKRGIRAEVDERDVGKICTGQHAVVTAPNFTGAQRDAVLENMSDTMIQREKSNGAQGGKDEGEVRTVMLTLSDAKANWPVGLRVSIKFQPCSPEQKGATR